MKRTLAICCLVSFLVISAWNDAGASQKKIYFQLTRYTAFNSKSTKLKCRGSSCLLSIRDAARKFKKIRLKRKQVMKALSRLDLSLKIGRKGNVSPRNRLLVKWKAEIDGKKAEGRFGPENVSAISSSVLEAEANLYDLLMEHGGGEK